MSSTETPLDQNYRDVAPLGEGGMGRVVQATDSRLERHVAVKTLRAELCDDPQWSERFMSEARCMGQLDHPGIPPIYELGASPEGSPYFAMKLIRGETLTQVITKLSEGDADAHSLFTFERRLAIGISLCDSLVYAHKLGWLHRDIKPDNIMIGGYGEVLLTDWGLAMKWGDGAASEEEAMGTPGFCSPEQMAGAELDPRTDVFALGATLYELFTLRPAFEGADTRLVLAHVMQTDPPMADEISSKVQGRVPREIAYVLVKALSKDRDRRFQSASELRAALQNVSEGEFPVQCLCTGMKRSLSALAEFIDNYRGLAASLVIFWFIAPLLLASGLWYVLQHP